MTTHTGAQAAARDFFIAYFGPRPPRTSQRTRAAFYHWCRVQSAFLDPAGGAETLTAARVGYERKQSAQDPLAGSAYNHVRAVEVAAERAQELRDLYEQTLATGVLPDYWQGYAGRPGARLAARRFEAYLVTRRQPQAATQTSLFS